MHPVLTASIVGMVFAAPIVAQDPAATPPAASRVAALVRVLDADSTDWIALQDAADKAAALGTASREELSLVLDAAAKRPDRRYMLRLLGVLARIDVDAVARLGTQIDDTNQQHAAIAARVLGRSGADPAAVARELIARLETEHRPLVVGALALAAADAGCKAAAPAIRRLIAADAVPDRTWLHTAHAVLAVGAPATTIVEWLGSEELRPSALLLARTCPDPELAAALLGRRGDDLPREQEEWLLQSLGAIGGRDATVALLTELRDAERSSGVERSTPFDARRLALLRLGDMGARQLASSTLRGNGQRVRNGISAQIVTADLPQLAELLGKWRLVGSAAELVELADDEAVLVWSRSHAARGLCWQRDVRGLQRAAKLLAEPGTEHEFGVPKAHEVCQATLHQFVANADRPAYVPLRVVALDPSTAELAARWQEWLEANAAKITWREPYSDGEMLLWQ